MGIQTEFSADVRLDLLVNGQTIPLSKVGPNYAVLSEAQDLPAGAPATLVMNVDGREHRWEVVLKEGGVPFDNQVTYVVTRYPHQTSLFHPLH